MTAVLVTGAAGFIGRHLTSRLAARGHRVAAQSRTGVTPGLIRASLDDEKGLAPHLDGIDIVVHLAGTTGRAPPGQYFQTNVGGTATLLRAAERAGVSRFLFVSSIAVTYPDKRRCWYAQSKEEAERLVKTSPLASTIVRPTQVLGHGSAPLHALRKLASLPIIPAFGGGRALMQPVCVTDLTDMIADIVDDSAQLGRTLELGGPEVIPVRSLLDALHRRICGKPARFLDIPMSALINLISVFESISYRSVPFTVGQLAAFRFDGTAQPNQIWERRRASLLTVNAMIDRSEK